MTDRNPKHLEGKSPATDSSPSPPALLGTLQPVSILQTDNWADYIATSDHVEFFRNTNWTATHLGALATWGVALRLQTFMLFADSRPAVIYWGSERVAIYNVQFIPLAYKVHPKLMGSPFYEGFPELWGTFQGMLEGAEENGVAIDVNEMEMTVERGGFSEEAHFSGNFIPLRGDTGKVEGFYNPVHEVTKSKINERRRRMLNKLQVPTQLDTRRLSEHVLPVLESNPTDIPAALLYKVQRDTESESCHLLYRGNLGIPDKHPFLVEKAELNSGEGLMPLFKKAEHKAITVPADERFSGIQWRGYGKPSDFISIMPVRDSRQLYGFLMIATNPRRPIDDDHDQFVRDLSSQLCAVAEAIVSGEETRNRAEQLEKELAASLKQRQYMAENASFGMASFSPEGKTIWANEQYYMITEQRLWETSGHLDFIDCFMDDDRSKALDQWVRLCKGETKLEVELRLKRHYTPPIGPPEPAKILAKSSSRIEDGKVTSIMTSISDVSAFCWAQDSERRKAKEANDAKKQQEEFIDFVSHELRNPLSAIFQLAETITTSFPELREGQYEPTKSQLEETVKGNVDNANTILICAKHQKRIVDDVLTLSKLEYSMISIAPRSVQLPVMIERSVKMFEAETLSHNINIKIIRDKSLQKNNVEWVLCDESRVQQILINLLTNAIKFTKAEQSRSITVEYGVITTEPRDYFPQKEITWAKSSGDVEDLTLNSDWGVGQPLFLAFSVTDTGVGMTEQEIKKLFNRFEQASVKTSIKYGGSGLGLYLSQKLAEVQGGEIGVTSTPKLGSTFAFYIKSRLTFPPTTVSLSVPPSPLHLHPLPPPPSISTPTDVPHITPNNTVDLSQMHVLLVEDNIVNQQVVCKQLKKAGCVVHLANHGLEALEIIRRSTLWIGGDVELPSIEPEIPDVPIVEAIKEHQFTQSSPNLLSTPTTEGKQGQELTTSYSLPSLLPSLASLTLSSPQQHPSPLTLSPLNPSRQQTPNPIQTVSPSLPLSPPGSLPLAPQQPIRIDIILMDWQMPILDGLSCTRHIRHLQTHSPPLLSHLSSSPCPYLVSNIPIIVTTANAREEQVKVALESGVDDVVCKPFLVGELVRRMRERLGGGGRLGLGGGERSYTGP